MTGLNLSFGAVPELTKDAMDALRETLEAFYVGGPPAIENMYAIATCMKAALDVVYDRTLARTRVVCALDTEDLVTMHFRIQVKPGDAPMFEFKLNLLGS